MPSPWIDREKALKTEIIQIMAPNFLETKPELLSGIFQYFADNTYPSEKAARDQFTARCTDAHSKQDTTRLKGLLQNVSLNNLLNIAEWGNIDISKVFSKDSIKPADLNASVVADWLKDKEYSAAISITTPTSQETISSSSIDASRPFPILSVGKMFTGALMIKMLQNGIISEDDLDKKPPQLDHRVLDKLPQPVRDQLMQRSLRDLMTHQSGLGDYLSNYQQAISKSIEEGKEPPIIDSPLDFLEFSEPNIHKLDGINTTSSKPEHYSNLGILLAGLAIEHAYNQKHQENKLSYDKILDKFIIEPAGLNTLDTHNQDFKGITNPEDKTAPYVVGSPAGGYWMPPAKLAAFGIWLAKEAENAQFLELMTKHGTEFYDEKRNIISHFGDTGFAGTLLRCDLKTKPPTVIAILSNKQGEARDIIRLLEHHALKDRDMQSSPLPPAALGPVSPVLPAAHIATHNTAGNTDPAPSIGNTTPQQKPKSKH